jgi:uncharacterized Tic20 family protein
MSTNDDRTRKGYWKMTNDEYYATYRNASAAWYLLPIFFGIIGGVTMWLALKNEDPRKAKKGLILGVILIVAYIVLWFVISTAIRASIPTTTPTYQFPAT